MGRVVLEGGAAVDGGAINLARVAPFRLGAMEVIPATRQLRRGNASDTLEPRVMQVLVALGQANGAVITRDDLIASCWGGRIVGDNAIQRTISRLRDVSESLGANCFRLETVNKVGYRLIPLDATPATGSPNAPKALVQPSGARWRRVAAAVALLTAVAGLGLFTWTRSPASVVTTIAIAAQNDRAADLAEGLAVDIARLANTPRNTLLFESGKGSGRADYLLKITKTTAAAGPRADVALFRPGSAAVLWSASFAGRDADSLRPQIANGVFRVTSCALQINSDPGQTGGDALRLLFSACERLDGFESAMGVTDWRAIVARAPANARALATLALQEAIWAEDGSQLVYMKEQERSDLVQAARRDLSRARTMDPSLGLAYAAEAWLIPETHYAEKLAVIDRGLAVDPNCADLHALKSRALLNVGRMDDGRDEILAAVKLEPSSSAFRADLALTLAYAGYVESAAAKLEWAEHVWPDSEVVREARQSFDFRYGDPARLLRKIETGGILEPYSSRTAQSGWMHAYLMARAHPSKENIEKAVKALSSYANPLGTVQSIVHLGRIDAAYAYASQPKVIAWFGPQGTYVLFRAYMRPFLFNRQFMGFADRLGLVRYWQTSGKWPDFCYDKDVPYDCKAEAHRLRSGKAA